jgi:hypothetical protein
MKTVTAVAIGSQAGRLLEKGGSAQVIGSTSKGLFLLTDKREVVFVSYEAYRSPLTISLGVANEDLRRVDIGDPAELVPAGVILAGGDVIVDCSHLTPWAAELPRLPASDFPRVAARVRFIAGEIARQKPGIGFSPLISALLLNRKEDLGLLEDARVGVRAAVVMNPEMNGPAALTEAVAGLIGFGRGLTPSGDDLAVGFLLALNRWGLSAGSDPNEIKYLNEEIVRNAEARTTSLSQNLIRLAASGEGDERQMAVIDGIMCGRPPETACLDYTLEMGNSSGIDAFLGMAAGILWIGNKNLQDYLSF